MTQTNPERPAAAPASLVEAVTRLICTREPDAALIGFWLERGQAAPGATRPGRVVAVFTLPAPRYLGLRHRHDTIEGPLAEHDAWLVAFDAETTARLLLRGNEPTAERFASQPTHDPLGTLASAPRDRDFAALDAWLVALRVAAGAAPGP